MTFLDLQTRLAERRGGSLSQTATATRYKNALNEAHKQILRMPPMHSLRYAFETFASVASTPRYALPTQGSARVDRIFDTTNRRKLIYKTLDWLREQDPAPSEGTPCFWVPTGTSDVATQPSDASEIFVKSTSASDTAMTAYIEGIITGGYTRTASVQLTGTTAVTLSAAITSFVQVTKFYLSAAGVGTITLHEDSGAGTELARITIGKTRANYVAFLLYPTPSAVITYSVDVTRGIPDMSNNTDEPLLPEDFHDLLLDAAELRELKKQDDPSRFKLVKGNYDDGINDLTSWLIAHPDYQPMTGQDTEIPSVLGAFFPAGT